MRRYRTFTAIGLVAALLLSACSQEELGGQGTALPEGEYPLRIGSVSLTAEVSEQPWTRVSENPTDGMSSVWTHDDKIGVRIGDDEETGIYVVKLDAEGTVMEVVPEKPVYWKDKQPATITAWYPVKEELDFTHQDQGLTYLLQATGDGNYQSTPINLNFTHKLAKVRVKLEGTKADEVTAVTVRSYPTSTHSHGTLDSQDRSLTPQYVPMREATYNGVKYWEANLRPGYLDANNSFQVANADGVRVQVTQDRVDIKAGHVHTVTIRVGEAKPVTTDISDDGTYIVSETRTEPVNITGGSPTIYLKDANINVSDGPAINITNGNPIIRVFGENNTITSSNSAGIYVASGSTVTIKGYNEKDVLKITGNQGCSGIGGYIIDDADTDYSSCGDITIENITLYAYNNAGTSGGTCAPGIGSINGDDCGKITINNATIHAYGTSNTSITTPGIGSGHSYLDYPKGIPIVSIMNSTIHAYRGSPGLSSDYIGWAGSTVNSTAANSTINLGGGTCTSSTVYCYTGNTLDKTVVYDENGIDTEQSQ